MRDEANILTACWIGAVLIGYAMLFATYMLVRG